MLARIQRLRCAVRGWRKVGMVKLMGRKMWMWLWRLRLLQMMRMGLGLRRWWWLLKLVMLQLHGLTHWRLRERNVHTHRCRSNLSRMEAPRGGLADSWPGCRARVK